MLVEPLWKSICWLLRKLEIFLPEDPDISLLGIYPEDAPAFNKDICSTMFIAALFTIARNWIPRMDKENVVHLHNRILLSF